MGLKEYCGSDSLWPNLTDYKGDETDTLGENIKTYLVTYLII